MSPTQTMDLTVAICTFNRVELLRQTLASLSACAVPPGLAWEVLVIDNAGQEPVAALVGDFAARLPVRYDVESNLGTSWARNRAVRQAAAPIILFTDDDVTFDPHWLAGMWRAIREHGECDFWGGRVEPVWPDAAVQPPAWFDVERCPMLGDTIVQYHPSTQPRLWVSQEDPPFYTANLALRVAPVAAAGYFDTRVGHRGDRRMGMEDSLMVRTLASRGKLGWYAADAVVYHPVPVERLTRGYARRFAWRQGWLAVHLARQEHPRGRTPRWLIRAAAERTLAGAGRALLGLLRADPAGRFAGQMEALFNVSKLAHAVAGRGRGDGQ